MKARVFISFIIVELLGKYHLMQTGEGTGVGGYTPRGHQVDKRAAEDLGSLKATGKDPPGAPSVSQCELPVATAANLPHLLTDLEERGVSRWAPSLVTLEGRSPSLQTPVLWQSVFPDL